jgi:hypothetical protein
LSFLEEMVHKFFLVVLALIIACTIIVYGPATTSDPAASPADRDKEDLSRLVYPSLTGIKWKAHFIMPHESLERLFGDNWVYVARFNRIDRRHVYPGMTIKVPENIEAVKNYNPLPLHYGPAEKHPKYVLVDVKEQWLGAYEYGELAFSTPAATGIEGHLAPVGIFEIDARHKTHTSSLYKTHKGDAQYPMDYALRFHIDRNNVAFWIHARDLPGRPASHGCIGVYDEEMQKRVYGVPEKPVINDAARLFYWVADENEADDGKMTLITDGPAVEIRGELPLYLAAPAAAPAR